MTVNCGAREDLNITSKVFAGPGSYKRCKAARKSDLIGLSFVFSCCGPNRSQGVSLFDVVEWAETLQLKPELSLSSFLACVK